MSKTFAIYCHSHLELHIYFHVSRSYFDNVPEESEADLAYQPAPGSPSYKENEKDVESDGSDDPLDAFMQEIEVSADDVGFFITICEFFY